MRVNGDPELTAAYRVTEMAGAGVTIWLVPERSGVKKPDTKSTRSLGSFRIIGLVVATERGQLSHTHRQVRS